MQVVEVLLMGGRKSIANIKTRHTSRAPLPAAQVTAHAGRTDRPPNLDGRFSDSMVLGVLFQSAIMIQGSVSPRVNPASEFYRDLLGNLCL